MNQHYTYPGMDIWKKEKWDNVLPVDNLAQWIGKLDPLKETKFALPPEMRNNHNPNYIGFLAPEEVNHWEEMGMNLELHHIWIAKWISLVPKTAVRNSGTLLPTILCLHQQHIQGPDWAMKALLHYRKLGEDAAKSGKILIITVTDGPDESRQYPNILMEATSLYPIDYNSISLNVSAVYETGHTLAELPGGVAADAMGNVLENPDADVVTFGDYRLLDIGAIWRSSGSPSWGQLIGPDGHNAGNASYQPNRFLHSLAAQRMVEPLTLENTCRSHTAPELLAHWERMGLQYAAHVTNYERWTTLTPLSALKVPNKKIPILLIFQEVYLSNDHLPVEAASYWYEFVRIAAQGECMLLFYACESPEHNRFMKNILLEACEKYPVDRTRVYVTGYSHNCATAVRFAYENSDLVTAVAGGAPGMNLMGMPPHMMGQSLQDMAKIDMPCIHAMGCCEHISPVGEPTFENSRHLTMLKHNALIAGNCEPKTMGDFRAALESLDKATRMTGVPNDRSEVLYLEGVEHYIADVRNRDGKYHLRFLTIQNAPHNPFPTMQILEWSFIRRFARDPQTGKIVELY